MLNLKRKLVIPGQWVVGGKADFLVIRRTETFYDSVFKSLVWEKSKHDVVMTIQDGKILQKNGRFSMDLDFDYDIIKSSIKMFTRRKK